MSAIECLINNKNLPKKTKLGLIDTYLRIVKDLIINLSKLEYHTSCNCQADIKAAYGEIESLEKLKLELTKQQETKRNLNNA